CGAVGGLMVLGDPAEQRRAVERALEAGISYFDTAALYGDGRSEENIGRVLRELDAWDRVVVGTKTRVDSADNPRPVVRQALEASLRRLGHDSVDVYHYHNSVTKNDLQRVLGEIARGFEDVVSAGLAKHAGFTGLGETPAIVEVLRSEPYETVQTYFNVLNPSAGFAGRSGGQQDFGGMIDTAASAGRGVIVIRVLAAGAATAQAARAENAGDPGRGIAAGASFEADVARAQALVDIARELGMESTVELALRFGLTKPGVSTVLVGYSNYDHLEQAIRFAERGPLAEDVVQRVLTSA
ncbi:MAG TPA: aldo/keto reductase, partial [Chloroflexota bacterium]|nr:aldo/keto reductase [Chloroflexota bacterium]